MSLGTYRSSYWVEGGYAMTTHDTRIGVFCRYCGLRMSPEVPMCHCFGSVAARDESRRRREITAAEELAESLIAQGWRPPESKFGEHVYWKMSGSRIIPDKRPRCLAIHFEQGQCALPEDHVGGHGWSEPKPSVPESEPEKGWTMGDGRWDAV